MDDCDLEGRLSAYRPVIERSLARRTLRPGSGQRGRTRWLVTAIAAGTVAAGVVGWVTLRPSAEPPSSGATGSVETTAPVAPGTTLVEIAPDDPVGAAGAGACLAGTSWWVPVGSLLRDTGEPLWSAVPTGTYTVEVITDSSGGLTASCVTNGAPASARTIALGDSVMAGAATALGENGIPVDATESRQLEDLVELVTSLEILDLLPPAVVIHVGTNGAIDEADLDLIMESLREVPTVVMLTVAVHRRWEEANNELIRALPGKYPNVTVVDWEALSAECPGVCFASDGLHLTADGADYYAGLIADALGLR